MPKLEQHLDGFGCYTRIAWGEDWIGTWQISPRGVDWLEERGCGVGQEFSRADFEELVRLRYATNDGGPIRQWSKRTGAISRSRGQQRTQRTNTAIAAPCLIVKFRHLRYELFLRFPERALSESATPLSKGHIDVRGRDGIISMSWKSFRSHPKEIRVSPTSRSYLEGFSGVVPSLISRSVWMERLGGLDVGGTLFSCGDREGERLPHGIPVSWGQDYLLLRRRRQSDIMLPRSLKVDPHGSELGWTLFRINLPRNPNGEIESWLTHLGHGLATENGSVR